MNLIRQLPFSYRSKVVKLCQAHYKPLNDDTALAMIVEMADDQQFTISRKILRDGHTISISEQLYFRDIVQHLKCLNGTILPSVLLDICRALPVSGVEATAARIKSWSKELSIMEEDAEEPPVNWRCLFDQQYMEEPIFNYQVDAKPVAGSYFRSALRIWLKHVSSRIHYPRMTTRNVSDDTREELERYLDTSLPKSEIPIVSQVDLQRIYLNTGFQGQEGGEVRQRWYPSAVKPRTYYSQGAYTYFSSAVLQDALGDLADCFPSSHRRSKLRPTRIRIFNENGYLRIYDLESFSSRLSIIRSFVDHLALFCQGTSFTYVDVRKGLVTRDLGECLAEYNQAANRNTPMSWRRFDSEFKHIPRYHHHAGCLGVFGNMALSTVVHNALILAITGDMDIFNVAGDDGAIAITDPDMEHDLSVAIVHMGRDQPDRRFRSDEPGAICLKRPIWQDDEDFRIYPILKQGVSIIPPSLNSLLSHGFGILDPRYRHFEFDFMTKNEHRRVIGTELFRCLRVMARRSHSLTMDDCIFMIKFIQDVSARLGESTPIGKLFPYFWPRLDIFSQDFSTWELVELQMMFALDVVEGTFRTHYKDAHLVPVMVTRGYSLPSDLITGIEFRGPSSKHLRFLCDLGFIRREPVKEFRIFDDFDAFMLFYDKIYDPDCDDLRLYTFEVLCDVPMHLMI
ncbi:hypothetical protein [Tulasnella ambivirus 2]|uniref:Uncharacterized protein n=1 Tax=Tulasnella ambivirus 2 TaxID=2772290 RepID=A0A7S8BET5_9VIRU|nr:hypothetical protein [Tulasnella ambivirus 2]